MKVRARVDKKLEFKRLVMADMRKLTRAGQTGDFLNVLHSCKHVKIFGQTSKYVGGAYVNGRSPIKYLNILARPETSLRWRPRLVVFWCVVQKTT